MRRPATGTARSAMFQTVRLDPPSRLRGPREGTPYWCCQMARPGLVAWWTSLCPLPFEHGEPSQGSWACFLPSTSCVTILTDALAGKVCDVLLVSVTVVRVASYSMMNLSPTVWSPTTALPRATVRTS